VSEGLDDFLLQHGHSEQSQPAPEFMLVFFVHSVYSEPEKHFPHQLEAGYDFHVFGYERVRGVNRSMGAASIIMEGRSQMGRQVRLDA
jgi:hypothetical protein